MFKKIFFCGMLAALISSQTAFADIVPGPFILYDWGFNVNGSALIKMDGYNPAEIPGIDVSGFDLTSGLGKISLTYKPDLEADFYIASFFDMEIDEIPNTYFNEQGFVSGNNPSGLTWEIDEPGYGNPITGYTGDIYNNLTNYSFTSGFDNMIFNQDPNDPNSSLIKDDVSVGLGWNFSLNKGDYAIITYNIYETAPAGGFYLSQIDPDSKNNAYFTTSLNIVRNDPGPSPVAEPACFEMLIAGLGIMGLFSIMRRNFRYF